MYKKFLVLFLCVLMGAMVTACGSEDKDKDVNQTEQPAATEHNPTDEELLEALKEDTNVVKAEDFEKTVADIKENITPFAGQIYQFEGTFATVDDIPCITNGSAAEGKQAASLPMTYLKDNYEEGAKLRVTGIVNLDTAKGEGTEAIPSLQALVVEELD